MVPAWRVAIYEESAPDFLCEIPAVEILEPACGCRTPCGSRARSAGADLEDIPPAARYIGSPYDIEAHDSKKRSTTWVGDIRPSDRNL